MSGIIGLIKRLEKATTPSFELDEAIWCALNPDHDPTTYNGDPRWKAYTGSIDAALTLVPPLCWSRVQTETRDSLPMAWATNEADEHSFEGEGATPALALCIAALKARKAAVVTTAQRGGK